MSSYSKAQELNDATYRNYCHTEQRNLALLHPVWIAGILREGLFTSYFDDFESTSFLGSSALAKTVHTR